MFYFTLVSEGCFSFDSVKVIFSLFFLMGVTWVTEIVSFAIGTSYAWIPTDVLNILTGIFIFVIFVCKRNVWKLLKQKWEPLDQLDRYVTRRQGLAGSRKTTLHDTSSSAMSKSIPPAQDADLKRKLSANVTHSTHINDSSHNEHESSDEDHLKSVAVN